MLKQEWKKEFSKLALSKSVVAVVSPWMRVGTERWGVFDRNLQLIIQCIDHATLRVLHYRNKSLLRAS